jgi:O-acetyl-ADP-ribose deacetylase (regulator of RNase III)
MNGIEYIKHDVTDTLTGVVAHGCNCQGVMGSGVAKAIRAKWPYVYDRYRKHVAFVAEAVAPMPQSRKLLGQAQIVDVSTVYSNSLFVANMFTQDSYGADGRVYADLQAIEEALRTVMSFCKQAELPLYMPQVGCGLGGLSWGDDVGPVVEKLQAEFEIPVFVCLI